MLIPPHMTAAYALAPPSWQALLNEHCNIDTLTYHQHRDGFEKSRSELVYDTEQQTFENADLASSWRKCPLLPFSRQWNSSPVFSTLALCFTTLLVSPHHGSRLRGLFNYPRKNAQQQLLEAKPSFSSSRLATFKIFLIHWASLEPTRGTEYYDCKWLQ